MVDKELRAKRLEEYKQRAVTAVQEGKIFRIISAYDVPRVKYELIKRGYVESISHSWNDEYLRLSDVVLLQEASDGNMYEQALLSRLIGGNSAKYMWITASQLYDQYQSVPYLSKINIRNHNFGTKDELQFYVRQINSGLLDNNETNTCDGDCNNNQNDTNKKVKYSFKGEFNVNHPRSYVVSDTRSILAFENDFRVTLATSLILHLNSMPTTDWLSSEHGSLDLKILDYAMALILRYIKWIKNEMATTSGGVDGASYDNDKDKTLQTNVIECTTIDEHRYAQLNAAHHAIIELGQSFRPVKQSEINENYIYRLKFLVDQVLKIWPSRKYDGNRNVWLLKPTNSSQGQGIIVTDNEKCILSHLKQPKKKFVIQKYIERPLLMYDTKFDIRQYFLITIDDAFVRVFSSPVSSIKFASSEFTLEDLDESIHITNAYVQQKYRTQPRPKPIPSHRMWSWLEFIDYLNSIGADFAWNKIYSSMKRQITAIVAASFDNIEKKSGRYELFGVDWLVTYDFETFLLEIQRPPGMGTYSAVSTLVCGTILEDVVRVTVDFAADPTASTGSFELIYQRAIQLDKEVEDDVATMPTTAVIDLNSMLRTKEATEEKRNYKEEVKKVNEDDVFTSLKTVNKNVTATAKNAEEVKYLNDASLKLSSSVSLPSSMASPASAILLPTTQEEVAIEDKENVKKTLKDEAKEKECFVGTVEVECY